MYQYQVSFGQAIQRAFSNYCCFSGRASRSEYWWFILFTGIINCVLAFCSGIIMGIAAARGQASSFNFFTGVSYLWSLFVLLPSLGLLFRRLHDTGRSGWNWCWGFLPLIGSIILIVYCCQPSQEGDNQYGPEPNMTDHY